jgi:hypothetical protein
MPRSARPALERSHHSAHRAQRGRRPHHRARDRRRRLSRQAVQAARADRSGAGRASTPRQGAAAGERGQALSLRGSHRRSADAARHQCAGQQHRIDRRRVRSAQDLPRSAGPRIVARPAARSNPRPRRRRARPLDRRSGQPLAPQAGGRGAPRLFKTVRNGGYQLAAKVEVEGALP